MSDAAGRLPKRRRPEVRVTPEPAALIREAADLEHATVTSFLLDTVTARAATVIEQRRDMTLSNEALDRSMGELDVVGYFSLTMGSVLRSDAPQQLVVGCLPIPLASRCSPGWRWTQAAGQGAIQPRQRGGRSAG